MTKQTFPSTVQIAGDLGGTSDTPQVTGAHFGGSDGQYMIRRSGLWAPTVPSYADLSSVPASFTPSAHASTHDPLGLDPVKDLTRLASGPAVQSYTAWAFDAAFAQTGLTHSAGNLFLTKILTAHAFTINNVDFVLWRAGTGATPLANCFIGIYDSGGTRRWTSSDQSTPWATGGPKSLSTGGYTVTANDFIYIALLVGTQSTTTVQMTGTVGQHNTGLAVALARAASQLTGLTALPASITLASNALNGNLIWFGVK